MVAGETRAAMLERVYLDTGDMARALREANRAFSSRLGRSKLTDQQLAEIRQRRQAGEKLLALATEFGISEGYVSYLCFGVRPRQTP